MRDSGPPCAVESRQREAQLGARLGHPGVATVFDVGRTQGLAYVASECVVGFPLNRLLLAAGHVKSGLGTEWLTEALREVACVGDPSQEPLGKPPVDVMVDLACAVADALAHAHVCGVVHRDVKPSNIVVRVSGEPVLIDFGIAVPRTYDSTLTRTGVFVGTYDYAAPEQLLGNWPDLGTWTDTYALGATLFEMLTQRTPFEAASLADRVALVDLPPPHGPRHFNAAVPRRLDSLVLRALDPDPAARFHDGEEMAAALRDSTDGPRRRPWAIGSQRPRRWQRIRKYWALLRFLGALSLGASLALATTFGTVADMRERFSDERRKAAQQVLGLVLPQHRQSLQACVGGEAPLLAGGRRNPRFRATLQLREGVVVSVHVHGDNDFSWHATRCIAEGLKQIRLPGVGLGSEERVEVSIDLRL